MSPGAPRPGPTNSLVDAGGLRVGHAQRSGEGWLSGTTVILPAPSGAVAGVDVRGGAPGTRETDLLDPRNLVDRVHALVLSGGSAFGLASAHGVMERLAEQGTGRAVGRGPSEVVPIVPAAILFDLGRGGEFGNRPGEEMGRLAFDAAAAGAPARGCVGAGTGAVAGGLKGGVGSASVCLAGGPVVAALAVVNASGSPVDPQTGRLWGMESALPGEFEEERRRARPAPSPQSPGAAFNTTIGVVATDRALTKAQCRRLAEAGQDGIARAVRPAHGMFDGDTVFGLATGTGEGLDPLALSLLLGAAADCFARAIADAMLAATTTATAAGRWPAYSDLHLGPR